MGAVVFDNHVFDSWLTKKSDEILSKVDRETISTEEMLVLILKAQTNHFYHMDIEFRDEFRAVRTEMAEEFRAVRTEMAEEFRAVRTEMAGLKDETRHGFDRIWKFSMWQGGVLITLFAGLYLKLFFG